MATPAFEPCPYPYCGLESADPWHLHLHGCDQCNYHRPCIVCEGGLGRAEDEMTEDEIYECHACNCPHGPGHGYALWLEYRERYRNGNR